VSGRIRVLVWYRCPPTDLDGFTAAFHEIGTHLAAVPGLLRSELLRARRDEGSLIVASEWESADAFAAWESSDGHRPTTAPLRPYLDTTRPYQFDLYQVVDGRTAVAE
jgi:heme-degrading monooxygenase HmoA